jgi:hypothetical protein
MPKIKYADTHIGRKRLALIQASNQIVADYTAQGYRLTLRQLYYRLVATGVIPNTPASYTNLGNAINDARLCGLVDWDAIEDRTRERGGLMHLTNPEAAIRTIEKVYHNDLWNDQPCRVEVWVEKDALEGVIASACDPLDCGYFSCRGYTSQTAMWEAAQRFLKYDAQEVIIFHLGDHDPSGIDMTRDIRDRLELFAPGTVDVRRIALNMDQVKQYNPPPNPGKETDTRFNGYRAEFGDESWELDALEPAVLVELIQKSIKSVMDEDLYEQAKEHQEEERKELETIAMNYDRALTAAKGRKRRG